MSFLEECQQTILFSGLSPDVDAYLRGKCAQALTPNMETPWKGAGVAFSSRSARISFHNGTSATLFDVKERQRAMKEANRVHEWNRKVTAQGFYMPPPLVLDEHLESAAAAAATSSAAATCVSRPRE